MGNILSLLGRRDPKIEQNEANEPEVADPDVALGASNVDSNSEDDIFETMGHGRDDQGRPYLMVNGVRCFTRSQLDMEMRKDERKRMERVIHLIDGEGKPSSQPLGQIPENIRIEELEAEIEKSRAECKQMCKLADKLVEIETDIIEMEQKQATLENLRNKQNKRPIVERNMDSKRYFNVAQGIKGQMIAGKIGEQFVKFQLPGENCTEKPQDEVLPNLEPNQMPNQVPNQMPNQMPNQVNNQQPSKMPSKVPGSQRKRPIPRK